MKKRILLVEDDEFITQMYSRKLEEEGYEVLSFPDATEAKKSLQEGVMEINLILLDILLPTISGYDFLKWIKSYDQYIDIPVIMLSNLSGQVDIDKGYNLGAVDFIVKSNYTPNEVVRKVKNYIDK